MSENGAEEKGQLDLLCLTLEVMSHIEENRAAKKAGYQIVSWLSERKNYLLLPAEEQPWETVIPLEWTAGDDDFYPRSVPIHYATLGETLLSLNFPIWTLRRFPKTNHLKCL